MTIGRGDAPTLPPSGLWSSEEGLGRLSTHVRPCEFGGSTAGCHGERNISQETQEREQASQLPLRCMRATEYLGGSLRFPLVWQYWQEGRYDTEGLRCPDGLGVVTIFQNRRPILIYKCNKDVAIYFSGTPSFNPHTTLWDSRVDLSRSLRLPNSQ